MSEALLPLCCRGFRPALRRTGAREGEEEEGCRLGRVRSVILAKFAAARRQSGVIRAKRGLGGGGEARRGASTPRDASALLWVAVCLDRCQSYSKACASVPLGPPRYCAAGCWTSQASPSLRTNNSSFVARGKVPAARSIPWQAAAASASFSFSVSPKFRFCRAVKYIKIYHA